VSPEGGDLAAVMILFAAWRHCGSCGSLVLYVDDLGRATSEFVCGTCQRRATVCCISRPANNNHGRLDA
jgi:hypothetical protein